MGLALFNERRASDRRRLTGLLPGRLVHAVGMADLICRPTDVSRSGLGVVVTGSNKPLPIGLPLLLVLPDSELPLEVAWSKPDFGKQDSTRYGIVSLDGEVDLAALFLAHGCLK